MTGLVGLWEQCKGRQWAEGWWASPGSSPWPLSPCCGDREGKNTLTFFVQGSPLTICIGPILFRTWLCKVLRMYGVRWPFLVTGGHQQLIDFEFINTPDMHSPKIPSTQGDRIVNIVCVCFHCMSSKCLIRCSPLLARDLFMRGMCYILLVVPSPICTAGVKASKTFSDLKTGVGSFKDQPCLIKDSLFGKTTQLLPILMVGSTVCNFSHSETNPPFWQVAEVLLRAISG